MKRPPDDRILDELGSLIRQLTRMTGGADDTYSLTGTQRLALFELGSHGPQRLVDLAARLAVTAPTASRAVDALEAHGLVERQADPDDRRAQRIALTAHGRERFSERWARASEAFAPAAATLTAEERDQLATLLGRLRAALES